MLHTTTSTGVDTKLMTGTLEVTDKSSGFWVAMATTGCDL